jgi:hypothetical protein
MKKIVTFVVGVILLLSSLASAGPNPMLENIRQVFVTIDHAGLEPNKPAIDWAKLQLQIEDRLKEGGVKIAPIRIKKPESRIPDLRITIMMLTIPETEQFVFHVETSLFRFVMLEGRPQFQIAAPVWASSATMQSANRENLNDAIFTAVMRHAEAFVKAWEAAQPKRTADTGDAKSRVGTGSVAQAGTEQKYVASKNSKVFHIVNCSSAKTISTQNLVTFGSKDDALASGKQPCKKCNP